MLGKTSENSFEIALELEHNCSDVDRRLLWKCTHAGTALKLLCAGAEPVGTALNSSETAQNGFETALELERNCSGNGPMLEPL